MLHGYPLAYPGQVIGLLGGSFDPPHQGHVHITHRALRRFGLDRVWWLVSPGNPLKPVGPASLERRMEASHAIMQHPRVEITDIEAKLGTKYTADTLTKLAEIYPGVRFVWLMGADNLVDFHRWEHWERIMESVPIGVLARPGEQIRAGLAPAAQRYRAHRLPVGEARKLGHCQAPAWVLLSGPMMELSSTELRENGSWVR